MKPEDDVISLVDAAVIFVRRWIAFAIVFLVVVAIGIGYAFTLKSTVNVVYTTTIEPAVLPGKNNNPATLLTLIKTKWMAEAKEEYRERHGNHLAPVHPAQVQGTRLIEVVSRGANLQKEAVVDSHRALAELVVREQNAELDTRMGLFEEQLQSVEAVIQGAKNLPRPFEIRLKVNLEQKIQSGERAEILMLANEQRSVNHDPSRKRVIAVSVIIGLLLGFMAPFILEFACQVRSRLRELRAEQAGP
ncbi:hypothetical protein DIT71_16995 [Marinobacter vulgaris]|uniref:Lipopolysaccharide biosynthesis protein n=1 Tax=Marinobacter vulgaris TaxID=1928331 RepID=A0A2V3ZUC1_9GAMM|nr:hypothetical protein [Marinobacter vulgaris]PXX88884.1 hypothetical protein DIT71_16995 [Marinobacter vulgaris]TSJ66685.1 hypothetical protein FPC41_17090 [Marinobacter vulgaris]